LAYILLLRIHGCLCHYLEAMPKDLSSVIQQLIRWRKYNDFSQSEAVRILEAAGLPVKLGTLQHWEIGRAEPHPLSAAALAKFLEQQPGLKSSPSIDNKGARSKRLSPVVQQLVRWRASNQLSQSQAVRILADAGLPISVRTLQSWEVGRRSPQAVTAAALTRYLEQHPNLKGTNPRD
jgi:DNA-binding transcriptional regulator YiaG